HFLEHSVPISMVDCLGQQRALGHIVSVLVRVLQVEMRYAELEIALPVNRQSFAPLPPSRNPLGSPVILFWTKRRKVAQMPSAGLHGRRSRAGPPGNRQPENMNNRAKTWRRLEGRRRAILGRIEPR